MSQILDVDRRSDILARVLDVILNLADEWETADSVIFSGTALPAADGSHSEEANHEQFYPEIQQSTDYIRQIEIRKPFCAIHSPKADDRTCTVDWS